MILQSSSSGEKNAFGYVNAVFIKLVVFYINNNKNVPLEKKLNKTYLLSTQ